MRRVNPIAVLLGVVFVSVPVFAGDQKDTKHAAKDEHSKQIGNIAPYRRDLLRRIANGWKPSKVCSITVQVRVGKDGKLLNCSVEKSSGAKDIDQNVLDCVNATKFAPLPEWYQGNSAEFKIDLSKIDRQKDS